MLRRFRHAFLGAALIAATVAAPPIASTAGAQANQWEGFESISAPSAVDALENGGITNDSPAFSASVTEDLGQGGVDLWVNNHANGSEALIDFNSGGNATSNIFSATSRAGGESDSHGGAFTDIDGDGDEDFIESGGRGSSSRIFRNNNGTLQFDSFLGAPEMRARAVLTVDVDEDGDIDVLVTALDPRLVPDENPVIAPSTLFINDGTGNFSEATDSDNILFDEDDPGDQNLRYAVLTSTGVGNDPVIVTGNQFSIGNHTLALGAARIAEADRVQQSVGANNNASAIRDLVFGELDGNLQNGPEIVAARQDGTDDEGDINADGEPVGDGIPDLLGSLPLAIRNVDGNQELDIVSDSDLVDNCATVSLADFDNDADLDIFAGCAFSPGGQTQNVVLLNDGNGNFSTVVSAGGMPTTAAVSLVADFNGDGWMDAYVGGGFDAENGEDFVLINQRGGSNNWLQIDLESTANPDAAGAQVYVGTDKWQVREVSHSLHRGQDSRTLHFGLGGEDEIAPVEIRWPDGTFERCDVDDVNQRVTIEQGGDNCVETNRAGLPSAVAATLDLDPAIPAEHDPDPDPVFCNGLEVTINLQLNPNAQATNSHDVILGTEGADVIDGLDGRDTICALGGDDIINAGQGRDWVDAGAGDDEIEAGQGADIVLAGAGDDVVVGGRGNDTITGGSGDDDLRGQDGIDVINGNGGDDELRGGNKADSLIGGGGDDLLIGQTRADFLDGGAGIDEFVGGGGTDVCTPDPQGNVESRSTCELTSR